MASVPFIIERRVLYHGIWNTGLQVTEQFFQTIAQQYDKKPPCPTLLNLSPNALSLNVFSRNGETELRRDSIAFDALREIAPNAYDPRCLVILYINNTNRYSVIVCSCTDQNQVGNIASAFNQLKNYRLANPTFIKKNTNWTLQRSINNNTDGTASINSSTFNDDDSQSTRSRTVSGVMNETFAFLNNEYEWEDDVFNGLDAVEREAVGGDDVHSKTFHAGLQVNLEGVRSRSGSISSQSSFVSLQSLRNGLAVVEGNGDAKASNIAHYQYFKRNDSTSDSMDDNQNDTSQRVTFVGISTVNDQVLTPSKLIQIENPETSDYRSCGTQTEELGSGSRRYKKRPGSTAGSNTYKDMAAQRKGNSPTSPVTDDNDNRPSPYIDLTPSMNGNFLRARPSSASFHGIPLRLIQRPGPQPVPGSTISRSIENVYRSSTSKSKNRNRATLGSSRGRRVVYFS